MMLQLPSFDTLIAQNSVRASCQWTLGQPLLVPIRC